MSYGSISPDGKDQKPQTELPLTIDPADPFGESTIFNDDDFWVEVCICSIYTYI